MRPGAVVTCSYCMRELLVVATGTQVTAQRDARSLTDQLLHGYTGSDFGEGRRFSVEEMTGRDWWCHERGLWPIAARASTSWGGGWDARVLAGPPRVYPRHGDIRGAWAPRTRDSDVEWIEIDYRPDAPLVRAIRVFETNDPGASFAVTSLDGGQEELLWQQPPRMMGGGAQILEIELATPRRFERLRVYVSNSHGSSWAEIDTVCLVAAEPLPLEMRTSRPSFVRRNWGCLGVLATLGLAFACFVGIGMNERSSERSPMPAAPAEIVPNTVLAVLGGGDLSGVIWASDVGAFSSEYGESRNSARAAAGAPDVYPRYRDLSAAWAPGLSDGSEEFIELGFGRSVRAHAVVVVETLGAGAVSRVDDVTPGRPPAILWAGATGGASEARAITFQLAEPREISAVRLVLDTSRVAGWNEIDAVGLLPAP
jgi:hypothetical protein